MDPGTGVLAWTIGYNDFNNVLGFASKSYIIIYNIMVPKNVFRRISTFETLKLNSQEAVRKVKKLKKELRFFIFYSFVHVNPFHFHKKYNNRCTLLDKQLKATSRSMLLTLKKNCENPAEFV